MDSVHSKEMLDAVAFGKKLYFASEHTVKELCERLSITRLGQELSDSMCVGVKIVCQKDDPRDLNKFINQITQEIAVLHEKFKGKRQYLVGPLISVLPNQEISANFVICVIDQVTH